MRLSSAIFSSRRQALLAQLPQDSICIVGAARTVTRSRDTEFPFRQDSNFHYLSQFPEPDAVLVLSNHQRYQNGLTVLFCLPKDPATEIWHGRRVGPESAAQQFGLDQAYPLDDISEHVLRLIDGHQQLFFAVDEDQELDELVITSLSSLQQQDAKGVLPEVSDIRPVLHEMRVLKSDAEISIIQRACEISVEAHRQAMQCCHPGMYEYQLEAELHYQFARHGARHPAYGTIVGGGENACILHYTENQSQLNDGDLVLIDAGGEYQGYAADITRTFPVNGRFTAPQAALYDIVLSAQLAALEVLQPGRTLKHASDVAIRVITQGLIELGILSGELEDNIKQETFRQYFMHGLGHWLGLDVHDVGEYKIAGEPRPLEAGMVLTVEPGIYIAPDANVDPQWRGIGIRVEDNIVITDNGHINMTDQLPKQRADIEALMCADNRGVA